MLPLTSHIVCHELVIQATCPVDAVRRALEVHQDPDSGATFFTVTPEPAHHVVGVDLAQSPDQQTVKLHCHVPDCDHPVAPLLRSSLCFCWSHLAAYASHQAHLTQN